LIDTKKEHLKTCPSPSDEGTGMKLQRKPRDYGLNNKRLKREEQGVELRGKGRQKTTGTKKGWNNVLAQN